MSKEENISETEKKAKTIQITGKVSQETKDRFDELRESGGYDTFGQFMDALIERYYSPIKVNKEYESRIAELEKIVEDLREKVKEKEADNSAACDTINEEREQFAALKAEYNKALAQIEQLTKDNASQRESLDEYDTLRREVNGCISVPVTTLQLKCLRYMAERENRTLKRDDITPATFFQFAIDEIFIQGNRFSIPSVPNSVLRKFEEEIKNGIV